MDMSQGTALLLRKLNGGWKCQAVALCGCAERGNSRKNYFVFVWRKICVINVFYDLKESATGGKEEREIKSRKKEGKRNVVYVCAAPRF